MFKYVEFNTREKMMRCYRILTKDAERCTYNFHLSYPIEGKYLVYYLAK